MSVRRLDVARLEQRMRRLVDVLENWATWQRSFRVNLGYRSRSYSNAGCGATSFEDLCDESDAAMFSAVDAAVDDMVPIQRAAVLRRYGIAAVFRFPRENYETQLLAAHMTLLSTLPRRGVDIL